MLVYLAMCIGLQYLLYHSLSMKRQPIVYTVSWKAFSRHGIALCTSILLFVIPNANNNLHYPIIKTELLIGNEHNTNCV